MQYNQIRMALDKVEQTLRPWIGMADPKRYGWTTILAFGRYDGERYTPEDDAQYNALKALFPKLEAKGFTISKQTGEYGTHYKLTANGLFKPIKAIPEEFLLRLQFSVVFGARGDEIKQSRGEMPSQFLITPIKVDIADKYIYYTFDTEYVSFSHHKTRDTILRAVVNDIRYSYISDVLQGRNEFMEWRIQLPTRYGADLVSHWVDMFRTNGYNF